LDQKLSFDSPGRVVFAFTTRTAKGINFIDKMMEGLRSLAMLNSYLMSRSDSPIHLLTKSEDEIEKKVPSHSVAQALARKDLPVPGGPYKRIPLQG